MTQRGVRSGLGRLIHRIRKGRGLRQDQFSAVAGCGTTTLSRLERWRHGTSLELKRDLLIEVEQNLETPSGVLLLLGGMIPVAMQQTIDDYLDVEGHSPSTLSDLIRSGIRAAT